MTDIRDPKIDEKPPPWSEAKHHICQPARQKDKKTESIEIPKSTESHAVSGQQVEDLVRITLEARADHPDWSDDRIVQSVMRSYSAVKQSN